MRTAVGREFATLGRYMFRCTNQSEPVVRIQTGLYANPVSNIQLERMSSSLTDADMLAQRLLNLGFHAISTYDEQRGARTVVVVPAHLYTEQNHLILQASRMSMSRGLPIIEDRLDNGGGAISQRFAARRGNQQSGNVQQAQHTRPR